MPGHRIFAMAFSKVYPLLIRKAEPMEKILRQ
jgi:hypothetical protein